MTCNPMSKRDNLDSGTTTSLTAARTSGPLVTTNCGNASEGLDPEMQKLGTPPAVLRYAAFAATPEGGNPAGIVLKAGELDVAEMQGIAAEIGYAETAFVTERDIAGNARRLRVRFFSPGAEVPFCGHATIATAIALAEREGAGTFLFETQVGPVVIETLADDGRIVAAFTSVEPAVAPLSPAIEDKLLALGERHPDFL